MACRCGGGAEHEHAHDSAYTSARSLHQFIDFSQCLALNGLKPYNLSELFRVRSTDKVLPCSLLVAGFTVTTIMRFTGVVKIKSIALCSLKDDSSPKELRAYLGPIECLDLFRFVNAPDLDFSTIEKKEATQTWPLVDPQWERDGPVFYPTKYAANSDPFKSNLIRVFKFSSIQHLTLFIPSNFGSPRTSLNFIGIYGDFSQSKVGAVATSYELKPMLSDHRADIEAYTSSSRTGY